MLWPDFQPDVIVYQMKPDHDAQACFGGRFFKKFFDLLVVCEQFSVNGVVDMGKKAVFDRVPLGAVRRIMADEHLDLSFLCKIKELLFEGVMPVAVRPATVAQQQDVFGVWVLVYTMFQPPPPKVVDDESRRFMCVADGHKTFVLLEVEDAVRDHLSFCKVRVVMVKDLGGLFAQYLSAPVKVAQTFLFLGVYAQAGVVAHHGEKAGQVQQNLELRFPMRAFATHQLLGWPALAIAFCPQNALCRPSADRFAMPLGVQCCNLPRLEVRPPYPSINRAARRVRRNNAQNPANYIRGGQLFFFLPPPALRWRL